MGGQNPKDLSFKRQGQSKALAINSWATGELRAGASGPGAGEKRTGWSLPPTVNYGAGEERYSRAWGVKVAGQGDLTSRGQDRQEKGVSRRTVAV